MVKTSCKRLFFILVLIPLDSFATLEFRAEIPSVEMSEEAISLLECLAHRNQTNWEMVDQFQGAHRLAFESKNQAVIVTYSLGEKIQTATLQRGNAQTLCDRFSISLELKSAQTEINPLLLETKISETASARKKWIFIGLGGLALATGIVLFLSKNKQETQYTSIQMD